MRWLKLSLEFSRDQPPYGELKSFGNEGSGTDFGVSRQQVQLNQSSSVKAIQNSLSSENSYAISDGAQSSSDLSLQPRSVQHLTREQFNAFFDKFKISHKSTQSSSSMSV